MTKTCNKCGVELIPWENWYQSHMIHCDYVCKGCHSARMKERYASDPNLSVCSILKSHADELSDDPERLSTDFIVGLLKVVEE
jgi:hypothetical protein